MEDSLYKRRRNRLEKKLDEAIKSFNKQRLAYIQAKDKQDKEIANKSSESWSDYINGLKFALRVFKELEED